MKRIATLVAAAVLSAFLLGCGSPESKRMLSVQLESSHVEPLVMNAVVTWDVEWTDSAGNPRGQALWNGSQIPFSVSPGDRLTFTGRDTLGAIVVTGAGVVSEDGTLRIPLVAAPVS